MRWTAPSADSNEVSHYTVEHAADARFTNFRTVNTVDGDPATDTEAPTELTVPQSAHAFRPVTTHGLVQYGLNRWFTSHSRRSLACPHLCAGRILGDLRPVCPAVLRLSRRRRHAFATTRSIMSSRNCEISLVLILPSCRPDSLPTKPLRTEGEMLSRFLSDVFPQLIDPPYPDQCWVTRAIRTQHLGLNPNPPKDVLGDSP